ncbi:hypothetical protein LWI29_019932 [Acer saccharum]|uniref:RNase H type-1 domain-containing protein n=1 Tax=Acer saccharum TaxID=4024 RepID=A0AA39TCR0_ACESA|nr:hypothetical protein LWI29_019932 [Acer saccharum]
MDTLYGLFNRLGKEEFCYVCMLCWSIWNARNFALQSGQSRSVEGTINAAGDLLSEFQHTCQALSISPKPLVAASRSWCAPPPGSLKLNSDTAVKNGKGFIGVGAVIRDNSGKVVAAISKPVCGNFSAELGELIALQEGLLLAKRLSLSIGSVEVDAVNVAAMVNSGKTNLGDARFLRDPIYLHVNKMYNIQQGRNWSVMQKTKTVTILVKIHTADI